MVPTQLTLFAEDTRKDLANLSVLPGSEKAKMMTVTSGQRCSELYRKQDQLGLLVKTLLVTSLWDSTMCYLTWKASATPRNRLLYRLQVSVQDIDEKEYLLWPTPTVYGNYNKKGSSKNAGDGLATAVKMWPTPTARDWKGARTPEKLAEKGRNATNSLPDAVRAEITGQLNPTWVEWLMGFPLGWTDLNHSETL